MAAAPTVIGDSKFDAEKVTHRDGEPMSASSNGEPMSSSATWFSHRYVAQ